MRRAALVLGVAAVACSPASSPSPPRAESWPEADALFHRDPRWLGADGALTIPLGGDRTLWLFGDTFVANTPRNVRSESVMVRNTIGIERGLDPTHASIELAWRTSPDGRPASFFEERGETWHWPGHGVRVGAGGPVFVFLSILKATPGQGLGFASAGWRVARLDGVDGPPSAMHVSYMDPPASALDAVVGCAALLRGDDVVAFAPRSAGTHAGYLVRLRVADLLAGVVAPAFWTGAAWGADADAKPVMDDVGAECSVHFDARIGRFVHVASRGFGASTIAMRTAPALEGPWSPPEDVFVPPESRGPKPFVYAAKAHPELTTGRPDELVVTYATNSFTFADLVGPEGSKTLYGPRFVRIKTGGS